MDSCRESDTIGVTQHTCTVYRRAQRSYYVYTLRWNQDPARRLHYCFLTVPCLCIFCSYLKLLFGTQEGSWRLKPSLYKRDMGETELLCSGAPQGPVWFHSQFYCFLYFINVVCYNRQCFDLLMQPQGTNKFINVIGSTRNLFFLLAKNISLYKYITVELFSKLQVAGLFPDFLAFE